MHEVVAVATVASLLIGALVELVYRPARARDVRAEMREQTDRFFDEVTSLREEMRVRLAVLESKDPPTSAP